MQEFRDNDVGYLEWVARHPDGFVANVNRNPRAVPIVLHKSGCSSITSPRQKPGAWTHRTYFKMSSEKFAELEQWAFGEAGKPAKACGQCKPGRF